MNTRQALFVTACAAVFSATLIGLRVVRHGDVSALIGFGCVKGVVCFAAENRAMLPDSPYVFASGGYDGQFFYYIAREIYSGGQAVVDDRPLRYARIGYPVFAGWPGLAGPAFAMWGLIVIPWIVHLCTTFVVARRFSLLPAFCYALNPFSLISFLLTAADGLALSFATNGFLLLLSHVLGGGTRRFVLPMSAFVLLSLAVLSKETMLAVSIGAAAGAFSFISGIILPQPRSNALLHRARDVFLSSLLALGPLVLWWRAAGFAFDNAASHRGIPLVGMIEFLREDPGSLGRAFLIPLFFLSVLSGAGLLISAFRRRTDPSLSPSVRFGDLALGSSLLIWSFLCAFATREYWQNFANIARLFTPCVIGLVWTAARVRPLGWVAALLFGGLLFVLFREELGGKVIATVPF